MLDFEISPAEAAGLVSDKKARLIDVREPWEYATARIEGGESMPMGDVPSRAHQELDPEERLIVVCHHGMRSMNVAVWLRNQGFEQAQSLRGGIDAWSAGDRPCDCALLTTAERTPEAQRLYFRLVVPRKGNPLCLRPQ